MFLPKMNYPTPREQICSFADFLTWKPVADVGNHRESKKLLQLV